MKTFKEFIFDISEAAGDPIKPEQVIKFDDPEVQKNLRNTMTKPKSIPQKPASPFWSRYIRNTSYLFPTPL